MLSYLLLSCCAKAPWPIELREERASMFRGIRIHNGWAEALIGSWKLTLWARHEGREQTAHHQDRLPPARPQHQTRPTLDQALRLWSLTFLIQATNTMLFVRTSMETEAHCHLQSSPLVPLCIPIHMLTTSKHYLLPEEEWLHSQAPWQVCLFTLT